MLVVLLCCPFLLTGCPDKKKTPPASPPPPRIGVSLAGLNKDEDQVIKETMERQKDQVKADLVFADAGGDSLKQGQDVDRFLTEKVGAVVLEAVDPAAARDLVERLSRNQIKVVALNILPADTPVDAYVSYDRNGARALLTKAAAQAGNGGALVLTVAGRDQPEAWITQGNAAGLPVTVREYARGEVAAVSAGKGSVMKTGERPAALLAGDAGLAVAAVRELAAAGSPPSYAGGVGSSKDAFRYVSEGKLGGEVDTRPEEVAQSALQAALALTRKQPLSHQQLVTNGSYSVPSQIAPVRLITRQNLYLLDKTWTGGQGQAGPGGSRQGGGQGGSGGGSSGGGGEGDSGSPQNTLRITTFEGKTIEVHFQGKLKSIEHQEGGPGGQRQGGAQGGQPPGGSSG